MKHKHADLMIEYAKDWAETETPWKRWERGTGNRWLPIEKGHPYWLQHLDYRRKPLTININGFEVPEPVREPLEKGRLYYLTDVTTKESTLWEWEGDDSDYKWLRSGLIHLTIEADALHRKALLSFTEVRE